MSEVSTTIDSLLSPSFKISQSRKETRAAFKKSGAFKRTYEKARKLLEESSPSLDISTLRDEFAGELFEELAYTLIKTHLSDGVTLLTPDEVLGIYRKLYPDAELARHYFTRGLRDVYLPDLLLIGRSAEPLAAFECTLSGKLRGHILHKYTEFQRQKTLFPEFLGKTTFSCVLPMGTTDARSRLNDISPDIGLIEIPMTHHQFRELSNGIWKTYRLHASSPTLEECSFIY